LNLFLELQQNLDLVFLVHHHQLLLDKMLKVILEFHKLGLKPFHLLHLLHRIFHLHLHHQQLTLLLLYFDMLEM
jgi:hypothetical protein